MLSERILEAAQPTGKRYYIWDDKVSGFGVMVSATGYKSLLFKFSHHGKQHLETIGAWPGVKVAVAREWCKRRRSVLVLGAKAAAEVEGVPVEELAPETQGQAQALPTMSDLWVEYEKRMDGELSANEMRTRRGFWTNHLKPVLGALPVAQVKTADVDAVVQGLKAKARTAQGVRFVATHIMELAQTLGYLPEGTNPARRVKAKTPKPRERHLSADEWPRLAAAIDAAIGGRTFALLHAELFKLQLLTGARLEELLTARWDGLDVAGRCIWLAHHKTERHTEARARKRIELAGHALALVEALPRRNEYIFYGRAGVGHITAVKRPWAAILKAARIKGLMCRELRRCFSTAARSDGMDREDVGVLLGHGVQNITDIYARTEIQRRQKLAARAVKSVLLRMYPKP